LVIRLWHASDRTQHRYTDLTFGFPRLPLAAGCVTDGPCFDNYLFRWFPNWCLRHLRFHRRRADRNASSEQAEDPADLFANSELIGDSACVDANWELTGAGMAWDGISNSSGVQLMAVPLENREMQGPVHQSIDDWQMYRNWAFGKFCIELTEIQLWQEGRSRKMANSWSNRSEWRTRQINLQRKIISKRRSAGQCIARIINGATCRRDCQN
jgi:hypothetical protein